MDAWMGFVALVSEYLIPWYHLIPSVCSIWSVKFSVFLFLLAIQRPYESELLLTVIVEPVLPSSG